MFPLFSFAAKLAFCLVSKAFIKASKHQQDTSELPPLLRKGKVTPVKGSISKEPPILSMAWKSSMAAAPQAVIT